MANAVYPKAKERGLVGGINWTAGNIRVALVRTSGGSNPYTYGAAHQFLSSVHSDARVATSSNFGSKSVTDGVANAANVTFAAVPAGDACQALVIYEHVTDDSDSKLIAYIDSATGLPVTPNGGDITVEWDTGANKIFAL